MTLRAAVLLLLSVPIVNSAPAQQQTKQTYSNRKSDERKTKEQVIVGTIEWEYKPLTWDCDTPNCDPFALYNSASGVNYELDDSRLASRFEGKKVRVTGSVDIKNDAIHVVSIEEMPKPDSKKRP